MSDTLETARLISHFAGILAEEADRSGLELLARLLRDAEAEAIDLSSDGRGCQFGPQELIVNRLQ